MECKVSRRRWFTLVVLGWVCLARSVGADPLDLEPAGVAAWSVAPATAAAAFDREGEWREWYRARVQWRQGVRQLRLDRARNRRIALLLRQRGASLRGTLSGQRLDAGSRRLSAESGGSWVTGGVGQRPTRGPSSGRGRSGSAPAASDAEVPIELLRRPSK
ncbi:MAG: hypothetical protein IPL40_15780 [Proteobacteria bacterium]|nr:hypothetical protein [Pseudomonadota bacterium]